MSGCWSCGSESLLVRGNGASSVYTCQECGVMSECTEEQWNRRASGWISVEDRLPEEDDVVLVVQLYPNGFQAVSERTFSRGRFLGDPTREITHWQPLPAPPEDE